jgi:murein DD-endopeptidase MepM/ murein hydrolase activator NlpD
MRLAFGSLFLIISVAHVLYAGPLPGPPKINIPVADGFDYPVAKPNAVGYYKSRGWFKYHPGEDWVSVNHAILLGAPVYSIGIGLVVFTRNAPGGWGNVIIIRHAYYEENQIHYIDSFYAHLRRVLVKEGQFVEKGQQIGEIGTNRGMYRPHLHFEIRKNLLIGINRSGYQRNFNNYWIPTRFIEANRQLKKSSHHVLAPWGTFEFQTEFSFPIDESQIHRRTKATASHKKISAAG